ncbi:hypothetical protein G6F53_013784 [Rhizopus delemar]|nr:hypothetical protein G6F53_013784 [Rhizopus delemar]
MVLKRPFLRPPWVLLPPLGPLLLHVVQKVNSVVVLLLLEASNRLQVSKVSTMCISLGPVRCLTPKLVAVLVVWVLTPGGC